MEPVVKPIVSGQDVPRGHDPVGTLEIRPYASKSPRTTIVSFTFCGQPFDVLRGEKALTKLAEEIYRRHPAEFNKVRSLSGWFSSTDRMPKHTPTPIGDSGLSVYTTISTKNSKIKCYELVRLFGYTKEALTFETR